MHHPLARAHVACFAATLVALMVAAPNVAQACGGCFSPVLPPPPGQPTLGAAVLQNAERVVFLRNEATKTSRVWVEVRYSGAAADFGWVLPLPKVPTVGVGTTFGLDRLDQGTAARYLTENIGPENCRDPADGCDWFTQSEDASGGSADSFGGLDAGTAGGGAPGGVDILDQGQAGPYDYAVIAGKDAKQLQTWLDTRGYKTPAAALPILQSHADKGDVFVAIKLQNGKGIELIRPIVLKMQDAEPCVPLRLTSIAATDDVNVVVTLAGAGRAVPKNMLHVELNPARINWLGNANNYQQVVSAAIDEAAGRAFITESAQSAVAVAGQLPNDAQLDLDWAAKATNAHELALGLYKATNGDPNSPWLHPDAVKAFVEKAGIVEPIFKTFKLSSAPKAVAQLWVCGAIWSGAVPTPNGNDTCIPAGENFFSPSVSWTATDAKLVPSDGQALAKGLLDEFVTPLKDLRDGLAAASVATRMVLRIGALEMDRDPVFAFHPTLPLVARDRKAQRWQVCGDGWLPASHQRLEIPEVGSYLFSLGVSSNANDPRFVNAPFAARIEVLDEAGAPIPVPVAQVELVDSAIAGALPGTPSPAAKLALGKPTPWQPPPSDAKVTKLGPWKQPPWCDKPKAGWVDGKLPPGAGGDEPDAGVGGDGGDGGDGGGGDGGSDVGGNGDGVVVDAAGGADGAVVDAGGGGVADASSGADGGAATGGGSGRSSGCSAAATPASSVWSLWLCFALGALGLIGRRRGAVGPLGARQR